MNPNSNNDSDELIALSEAAQRYGFTAAYLRELAERGRLTARKIGRNWVTTPRAVEEFIASRRVTGTYRADIQLPPKKT